MRRLLLALVLAAAALTNLTAHAQGYVPLVTWLNDAAHQRDGDRLAALLHARGIDAVTTCSAGCTLSVASARYGEAMTIASDAIAREHLDVSLVRPPATS